MVTYKVVKTFGQDAWHVMVKESGVIVAGPFAHKGAALANANEKASLATGNRVES